MIRKRSINNTILTLIQIRTTIYTGDKYNGKCIRSPKEIKVQL